MLPYSELALLLSSNYFDLFYHYCRFLIFLMSSAMGLSSLGNLFDHWVSSIQMHLLRTKLHVRSISLDMILTDTCVYSNTSVFSHVNNPLFLFLREDLLSTNLL